MLDVLLQENRDTRVAKRFFRRLSTTRRFRNASSPMGSGAMARAIREVPELGTTEHITVSAAERQNNLIKQSHCPIRDHERQQRGFKGLRRAQSFFLTHAELGYLFRHTRARTPAQRRRWNWLNSFGLWDELSLPIT